MLHLIALKLTFDQIKKKTYLYHKRFEFYSDRKLLCSLKNIN